MNREILSNAVQLFLLKNEDADPRKIALAKSPFETVNSSELAIQIESRQKTKKKLPLWHNTALIYYPPALSIEQASSEKTARYKSTLIGDGESIIDLTGGFGIDAFYFSQTASKVVHCELNTELSEIVRHNAHQLGNKNISFVAGDGIDFLINRDKSIYDTIFIDPSRRVKTRKVFKLDDSEPDIVKWQEQILERANKLIIKSSPLLDITLTLSQLKNVKEVHVISIKNECKELLFVLEKGFIGEARIFAIPLSEEETTKFSFLESEEKNAPLLLDTPDEYLYDADSALMKAGCFKLIADRFNIKKLHLNTHLYTSKEKVQSFPGRTFKITNIIDYKQFKKIKADHAANVISKNFPSSVEVIRKKHKIRESKDCSMFFCKTMDETLQVIFAERS